MEVFLNSETRWEIDEEKIFVLYDEEWEDWKMEHGSNEESQGNFIKSILWGIVPHFEELGGIETYDDARIDIFFLAERNR